MEFSTTDEKDAVIVTVVLILLVIILVAALVTCCCIESKKEDTLCKRIFRSRDGERRPLNMSNSTTDVTVSYSSNQNTRNSRGLLGENEHQTKVKELSKVA